MRFGSVILAAQGPETRPPLASPIPPGLVEGALVDSEANPPPLRSLGKVIHAFYCVRSSYLEVCFLDALEKERKPNDSSPVASEEKMQSIHCQCSRGFVLHNNITSKVDSSTCV